MDGADYVEALHTIRQSPLDDSPDVPKGSRGHVDDEDFGYLLVDFGEPFGVVICNQSEVK